MGVSVVVVLNKFPVLAALVGPEVEKLLAAVAEDRMHAAQESSPVDTGAMQAAHAWEQISATEADVTVQKGADKTYGAYVNFGTIHMSAQPWFTDAMAGTGDAFARLGAGVLEGKG